MKRTLLIGALTLALAASGSAWSQTAPSGNGGGQTPSGENRGQMGEQKFQEHKAEMLKRLNEHLSEVQQRIGCVQSAANHEALRACMPQRGEKHGEH